MDEFEIVLVADRPLDEADVHAFRVFLHVHDGAVNDVHQVHEFNEKLVEVEK